MVRDSYLKGEESDTVRDISHNGAKLFMKWEGECFRSSTGESQPIPTLAFTSKVWGTFSTYPKVCSFSKPESNAISHGASLLFFSLLRFHFPDPFRCLFSVTPGSALQLIKLVSCLVVPIEFVSPNRAGFMTTATSASCPLTSHHS